MRFSERATRKLARSIFHGMVAFGPKLEKRQGILNRLVDIANEIFAMTAAISRAERLRQRRDPAAVSAAELAELFSKNARRNIQRWFHELWSNDDVSKYAVGANLLKGKHDWLEFVDAGDELSGEVPALPNSAPGPVREEPRPVARSA
jgi:hypothetical protein